MTTVASDHQPVSNQLGSTVLELRKTAKIPELLTRAKRAIETGDASMRAAAEDIVAAQGLGATQRQIAEAVGKSAAWVNRLLRWRQSGYQDDTAFGPQARASRQRARDVQTSEQKTQETEHATTSEQAEAAAARARAETTKAEAAKAKAEAQKAKAEAAKAKAEAAKAKAAHRTARENERARSYNFFRDAFGGSRHSRPIHSGARELLVKALGMLGSDQAGERAAAALVVEKQRAKLGMTWDELIIPANEFES
jgi:flagellar biosynthesis GTPase FlhF